MKDMFKITALDKAKFFIRALMADIETWFGQFLRPAIAVNMNGIQPLNKVDPRKIIKGYHRFGFIFYKGVGNEPHVLGNGVFGFGKVRFINIDDIKDKELKKAFNDVFANKK
jgi:hypothetical protein